MYKIKKNVQTELSIEKSRFLCTLKRVENEAQASSVINECKKSYWDATHNCSAYIIGKNMEFQKSNDDGEPAGTAGVPMLEVLKKRQIHNIVAVVTRYFGGIKLGAGGLIRAYGKSVSEAINEAGLCQDEKVFDCTFQVSPDIAGKAVNMLYSQSLFAVLNILYTEKVQIVLRIKELDLKKAEHLLAELFSREIKFSSCEEKYLEVPVS